MLNLSMGIMTSIACHWDQSYVHYDMSTRLEDNVMDQDGLWSASSCIFLSISYASVSHQAHILVTFDICRTYFVQLYKLNYIYTVKPDRRDHSWQVLK